MQLLVRVFRRFDVEVFDIQNKAFENGTYRMLQVWVRSALPHTAEAVRCECAWERQPNRLDRRSTIGLWLMGLGSDMGNFANGGEEETDLPANRAIKHLGLLVKYVEEKTTYIVAPNSYQEFRRTGNWRLPSFELKPGTYRVTVDFSAKNGERAAINLRVVIPATDAEIECYVD